VNAVVKTESCDEAYAKIIFPRDQTEQMVIENLSGWASKMLASLEPSYH